MNDATSLMNAFGIANVVIPRGGPKVAIAVMDFDGTDGSYEVDGLLLVEQHKIEYIQTLYIDNADNAQPLTVTMDLTAQRIIVGAGEQGYYSVLEPNPPKFVFTTTAGAFKVYVGFLNVPVQPAVWGGGSSAGLTDAQLRATPVDVAIADPVEIDTTIPLETNSKNAAYTNRSIANLTGASQTLMAANAARRLLIIQNVAANAMAVNLIGGTAALNTNGSINLAAGASIVLDTVAPTSAITIIGTLNDDVTAFEA